MKETCEINILYASQDNVPAVGKVKGWVDSFSGFLFTMLQEIGIIADISLYSEENFLNIASGFSKEKTFFICILSEGLTQKWGNLQWLNDKDIQKRLFKAIKQPVNTESAPKSISQIIGYRFYYEDPKTTNTAEINSFFDAEVQSPFWLSLLDMSYEIRRHIKKRSLTFPDTEDRGRVYLAETGYDLVNERAMVRRELLRYGYEVLPRYEFPAGKAATEQMINEDLSRCILSVHLIGQDYGKELADTPISIVELQNNLAVKHAKQLAKYQDVSLPKQFRRLIWIDQPNYLLTDRQKYYIDRILRSTDEQFAAELLRNRIEDFKTIVLDTLKELEVNTETDKKNIFIDNLVNTNLKNRPASIYIISDKRDVENCKPMVNWLQEQGYSIFWPIMKKEAHANKNSRLVHQSYLNACDATIIFFAQAKEQWLEAKLQDVLKAAGMGRKTPLVNKAIFTDSDRNLSRLDNIRLRNENHRDAVVILNKGPFSPESLESFLAKLER